MAVLKLLEYFSLDSTLAMSSIVSRAVAIQRRLVRISTIWFVMFYIRLPDQYS
jgi:hypothetical protein